MNGIRFLAGKQDMKKINREDIEEIGFTINTYEVKPYGTYLNGVYNYKDYLKLEITTSDVKDSDFLYICLRGSHFRGHVNGYIETKEELKSVVDFMTRDRKK